MYFRFLRYKVKAAKDHGKKFQSELARLLWVLSIGDFCEKGGGGLRIC